MRKIAMLALALMTMPAAAYDLKSLSMQDLHTIGRGLDKLPREDTDASGLYARLQSQITAQEEAEAKAGLDKSLAERAKLTDEIRAKVRAEIEAEHAKAAPQPTPDNEE